MIAPILIALAAGAASAVMFASIVSGLLISLALFYLAPLPLMVAAIAWGPVYAGIGGIAAAFGLGLFVNVPYCIAFVIGVALPAWWLGHLAMLGRTVATDAAEAIEWYPIGRILLWIAGLATLTTFAALLTLGTDADTITDTLRRALTRLMSAADSPLPKEADRWIDALIRIAPGGAAMFATLTLSLNLWLAGRIAATSGLLRRPWPDLRATALPPMTLVALLVAIGLAFSSGLIALAAVIAAAALLMAYALTGFAVLHTLTLALRSRALWLGSIYVVIALFIWPVLAITALGLADAAFDLRHRFGPRRPPPLPVP
ncbi:DUF2232 domain-containing protein [Bradyrhizobium sp. STM 3809]|uniref:DUF2232 domain-containing protein n=1 Tax=Bradyrhizobium sp. STM 3809 TaxID=551936 RepID=UPI0002409755|nr:DUF2232 domain-containing protein [Bradyrhizobium sp. STM 3809]CCE00862.1 conserved membrane hypothetical protein [Bradyrhizobium sp. STM 3809]